MKRMHSTRLIITFFLSVVFAIQLSAKKITVGVFNGSGAGEISVIETIEALKIDMGIKPIAISATDIQSGKLKQVDVLIFPGGSGSKQLNNLGKQLVETVKTFAKQKNKGVIGICAGSFLLSSTLNYNSLAMANVSVVDRAHYDRGRGLIEFELTPAGKTFFPELVGKRNFVQYYDGPILELLPNENNLQELAKYTSDIHPKVSDPIGLTPGKLFIYNQNFGEGRLFAIGGHPESTPGMRWMVARMARWVANSELISYNQKWIKPEIYSREIMFDAANNKLETELWWKLFSEETEVQIKAMDDLYALKSRSAVRWYIGMLRHTNPQIRAHAAELLQKTEYTHAVKDIKTALQHEEDQSVKEAFNKAIQFLKYN